MELDLSRIDINYKCLQNKIWIQLFFYTLVSFSYAERFLFAFVCVSTYVCCKCDNILPLDGIMKINLKACISKDWVF